MQNKNACVGVQRARGLLCSLLLLLAGPAFAATVIVTQTDDVLANESPIFGSLRDAIQNRASPGDTIVFDVNRRVHIADILTIPRELTGLTIQGPVKLWAGDDFRGLVNVRADNTTINGVRFNGVSIYADDTDSGPPRRIQGFAFTNNTVLNDANMNLRQVDNCHIADNRFRVDPQSDGKWALLTSRTNNCLVTRNIFKVATEAPYRDFSSEDLKLIDNRFRIGSVWLSSISGEVLRNRWKGRLVVRYPDFGTSNGLLVVDDNRLDSIVAQRTFINITNNRLKGAIPGPNGPRPALRMVNTDTRGPQGDVLIESNKITGGRNAISYVGTDKAADAVIHNNSISGCKERGITIREARNLIVSENEISNCGTDKGVGIVVGRVLADGVVLDTNTVSDVHGFGIKVVPQPDGNSVLLHENILTGNDGSGILLSARQADEPDAGGRILMDGNIVRNNKQGGIQARKNTSGSVSGGEVTDNTGDGIRVADGAQLEIRQVLMGANTGTGIDILPNGPTDNATTKIGNADMDWPENLAINPSTQQLEGTALPGSVVEVFVVESGARAGNPQNGEGTLFLGAATTGPDGNFTFPQSGILQCPDSRLVTLTATRVGDNPVTSEFSPDFDCVLPDTPTGDDDGDGIANTSDACPGTLPGDPVDGDGCAESQKDDDGDGKANDIDECPATEPGVPVRPNGCSDAESDDDGDTVPYEDDECPAAGAPQYAGCQGQVFIPGLGTAFLNDLAQSSIDGGAAGESCSDCSIYLLDNTYHSCFATGSFAITEQTGIQSAGCSYSAPALSIDGSDAILSSVVNEYVACEGGPGDCEISSENDDLAGSCSEIACFRMLTSSLHDNAEIDISRLLVSKQTVNGDGTFILIVRTGPEYPLFIPLQTESGVGLRYGEVFFGPEDVMIVEEEQQTEWEESVSCVNGDNIVGGEVSVILEAIPGEAFTTWDCVFTNTAIALDDTDGDGVTDDVDRCSNPGTNGNECPKQGSNDFISYYCNVELACSFAGADGNCTDCVIERNDGSGSIACPAGEVCVSRDDDVLQCPAGGCEFQTPNLTTSCGPGNLCTLDHRYSCQSDAAGGGCDGNITASGEEIGCDDEACLLTVGQNVLYSDLAQAAEVDFLKRTEGGEGEFTFDWSVQGDVAFGPGLASYGGHFSIETQNNVGTGFARFYIDRLTERLSVTERPHGGFELQEIDCASTDGVFDEPFDTHGGDGSTSITVDRENICTFVNVRNAVQPSRVEILPDGRTFPEAPTVVLPNIFGGQLNTSNPVVAIADLNGQVFIDVVTGEVPRAGNDRLAFGGAGQFYFDVLVQPDKNSTGADVIRTSGPGTVAYTFNPATGFFGFGQIGFDTIIDLQHLGNDPSSPALLSVNSTRNRIDLIAPPDSSGAGSQQQVTIVQPQHLQNVGGQLVSAQAFGVGRLDCYNPCQNSGSPMPAGCSAEIDAVIATPGFDLCASAWTRSCSTEYSNQNGDFCALPASERQVNFGGNILLLTDGVPGQVHLGNPALDFFGRVETVADVGDDPRRLRCLDDICAVSNFGSDSLTIIFWDGAEDAYATATVPVGDGPVGVNLHEQGENVVVLSTGSNDNSYAVTTVSPAGAVISNEKKDIPEGCEGPAHIVWVEASQQAFATCNSNHSYAVFEP